MGLNELVSPGHFHPAGMRVPASAQAKAQDRCSPADESQPSLAFSQEFTHT